MKRPSVSADDLERMADQVLLSFGPSSRRKYSAFWVLLTLAGVIATAGIIADSTATVIGAMIVAPLMTPILGTALALVLADRYRMARSLLVVVGGALLVIAIGYLFALVEPLDVISEGNGQVSARVSPRMIDLIAALATGTVGAFALARSDVSDTLPGVAIAISLVPPLAVVGITLNEGRFDDALGALLLFLTNVTAIVFTATVVLLLYQVRNVAESGGVKVGRFSAKTLIFVAALVALIAIPLGLGSARVLSDNTIKYGASSLVDDWADAVGWSVVDYEVVDATMTVTAIGPPPAIDPQVLRETLDGNGFSHVDLVLDLVVGGQRELPGR